MTIVRRRVTVALTVLVCLVAIVLAAAAGAAPAQKPKGCVVVSPSTAATFGVPAAGAVKAKGEMGGNRKAAWYVAAPNGAVWAVNTNPSVTDFGGLALPMNQTARATSDVGTDIPPKSVLYGTLKATAKEIKTARACAGR